MPCDTSDRDTYLISMGSLYILLAVIRQINSYLLLSLLFPDILKLCKQVIYYCNV